MQVSSNFGPTKSKRPLKIEQKMTPVHGLIDVLYVEIDKHMATEYGRESGAIFDYSLPELDR